MNQPRLLPALSAAGLFACLSLVALSPQEAAADQSSSVTYIITNMDATTGAFASRGAITFNADNSLFVIDSGQGGPTDFFSSQQGTWGTGKTGFVGRTIDFDFKPNNDVARLDYTFNFGHDGSISGTIALYIFPLKGNPNGRGGTLEGTFNFTGYEVPLP
jgi:hypothetical protein